jgi:hypothetical protein
MPLTVSNSFSGVRSISGGVLSRLFPTVLAARPLRVSGILSFLDIEFRVQVHNLPAFFKLTASIFIDMILSTLF